MLAATCVSISIGLRSGADMKDYVKRLLGVSCDKNVWDPYSKRHMQSCVDALAEAICEIMDYQVIYPEENIESGHVDLIVLDPESEEGTGDNVVQINRAVND